MRASEGTNPCTRPSFATKNVFDVLQDLSESIGGSPGPQLDAADGQPEPIVHDLHQSLVELLERPEILSLHAVRRVGRERQLHLKVRALCGEVEKVFDVLVDTGAQVSLVKAGLLPPECLTDSRKPVRLKVANGQYMVGGTKEAAIGLQFVNHRELSRPDLGKEILLHGRFYEAEMDWDMILGYDFMMDTDSGVLPAQASMTLYQDDQLSWLSSPEHHVECQWIHPERNQLEVAALDTEPTGPANQEYGVMPEVANRVVADLGASDLALDAFSSGTSAHLLVCEKYWSAQDSAWKKHWGPHQGLLWIHCPRWDIPRAIAKIRKDRSKAVLVVPMGCTEEESTRHWVACLTNMTLNKVVLPAGESVYQDAKGQPMPPQRWPTEFHYVDGGLDQADATDFVCVNRIIAEPWRQCFAVPPVDIEESDSEDPLTRFGPPEAGDGEMRQGATGRRQGGDRKTTGWRQEDDRKAAGKRQESDRKRQAGDRKATGELRQEGDRRATGRRQGGDRETTGKRQETRHSDRISDRKATGRRQEGNRASGDREATGKQQGKATGERQESDRRATGERQGVFLRQEGDRKATGRRQESDRLVEDNK